MNATYIHLLLNHFPIIGSLIGSALLFWGIIRKQQAVQSAALILIIIMAALAIPVFLTGEPAEESVEKLPGVSESMMEMHEEAAEIAMILLSITGVLALVSLIAYSIKSRYYKFLLYVTFSASIIGAAAMARTGYYGGRIRHSEIVTTGSGTNGNIETNINQEDYDD